MSVWLLSAKTADLSAFELVFSTCLSPAGGAWQRECRCFSSLNHPPPPFPQPNNFELRTALEMSEGHVDFSKWINTFYFIHVHTLLRLKIEWGFFVFHLLELPCTLSLSRHQCQSSSHVKFPPKQHQHFAIRHHSSHPVRHHNWGCHGYALLLIDQPPTQNVSCSIPSFYHGSATILFKK